MKAMREAVLLTAAREMKAQQRFRGLTLAALIIGLIALAALVGTSIVLFQKNRQYSAWVDHTYVAQTKIGHLANLTERLETARRGYLLAPGASYWATYADTRQSLPAAVDDFAAFTSDNPAQRRNSVELRGLVGLKLAQVASTLDLARAGDLERARRTFVAENDQQATVRLRLLYARMLNEEQRLLGRRAGRQHDTELTLVALSFTVAALLVLLAAGIAVLVSRYASDLRGSQNALRRLNEGLEDAVRERTAELTRANEEIQRFAYIVSHDLRSPLVNVMGFTSELEAGVPALQKLLAEADEKAPGLVSRDAREVVTAEIPEAIGFIRASTRKMDRLINAILKLSREGRRTLSPEPLNMQTLARGVADSLKQLADGKGAVIEVEPSLPDMVGDRVAMEQLLSNLTENAVKYLSPDRPGRIVLRGGAKGPRVAFEVVDNGRGIDARDHERIFELFRRSGQQDQPGEGIGLAHVRALVYRLGGTITVDSELGRGSTFRVDLPRQMQRDEGHAA